jgi:hypothetical protein
MLTKISRFSASKPAATFGKPLGRGSNSRMSVSWSGDAGVDHIKPFFFVTHVPDKSFVPGKPF